MPQGCNEEQGVSGTSRRTLYFLSEKICVNLQIDLSSCSTHRGLPPLIQISTA